PSEGRAGRGTGRGAVRRELLIIGFPLSLTLPTPSSWGEGNISSSVMVAVSRYDPCWRYLNFSVAAAPDSAHSREGKPMKTLRGFTLIELLVVIAIIA